MDAVAVRHLCVSLSFGITTNSILRVRLWHVTDQSQEIRAENMQSAVYH
jgi:hypothetical protein